MNSIDNISENELVEMANVRGLLFTLDHYGLVGLANHVNGRLVPRSWLEDEQRDHQNLRIELDAQRDAAEYLLKRVAKLEETLREIEQDAALLGAIIQWSESPQGDLVGSILKRCRKARAPHVGH